MFRLFYTYNPLTTHTSPIAFKSARRSINNQKRKRNKIWEHEILKWFLRPTNKPAIQSNYHYYFTILNHFDQQQEKERITQQYLWVSIRFFHFCAAIKSQTHSLTIIMMYLLKLCIWYSGRRTGECAHTHTWLYCYDEHVRASTRLLTHTYTKQKINNNFELPISTTRTMEIENENHESNWIIHGSFTSVKIHTHTHT